MKSIAYIIPAVNNKAPIKIAIEIIKNAYKDYQVEVFYLNENKSDPKLIDSLSNDINIKKLKLAGISEFKKFDIIHTHCFLPDLLCSLFKLLSIIPRKAKLISTIHCDIDKDMLSTYGAYKGKIISTAWKFALKCFSHVILLNNDACKKYEAGLSAASVIWNGVDLIDGTHDQLSDKIREFANGRKVIGAYGVTRHIKGFDLLLKSAKDDYDNCYVIAGDGPDFDTYSQYIEENNLSQRVLLLGFVTDAYKLIKEFDLFVLPSRSEGFPLAAIEGLWSGKKIVCSDIKPFKEIFSNSNVTYFQNNDSNVLSQKITEAMQEDGLIPENIQYYQDNLTSFEMYQNYRNIYES